MNGSLNKDNRIGLGIENPLTKMVQGLVESGVTGGETGHKHIEIGRIGFTVLLHLVMDFHLMRLPWKKLGGLTNSLPCLLFVCRPNLPHMEFSMRLARVRWLGVFPKISMLEDMISAIPVRCSTN